MFSDGGIVIYLWLISYDEVDSRGMVQCGAEKVMVLVTLFEDPDKKMLVQLQS